MINIPAINKRTTVIALVCVVGLCGNHLHVTAQRPEPSTAPNDELSELRRLADAEPQKDFEADKAKNDIHFIGLNGISILVPGVGSAYRSYPIKTRIIAGTSDGPMSQEQLALTKKAMVYAAKYNELVLEFLAKQKEK